MPVIGEQVLSAPFQLQTAPTCVLGVRRLRRRHGGDGSGTDCMFQQPGSCAQLRCSAMHLLGLCVKSALLGISACSARHKQNESISTNSSSF